MSLLENTADNQSTPTSGVNRLSQEETRQILTPFAFEMDKTLFGSALASPTRRALAILLDMIVIAMLSDMPGELLATVFAFTLYGVGNKKRAIAQGKIKGFKRRALLRFFGIFVLFSVIINILPESIMGTKADEKLAAEVQKDANTQALSTEESLSFITFTADMAIKMVASDCETKSCWQQTLSPFMQQAAEYNLSDNDLNEALKDIIQATELEDAEQVKLQQALSMVYKNALVESTPVDSSLVDSSFVNKSPIEDIELDNIASEIEKNEKEPEKEPKVDKPIYSIIEWIKGIIEDLGLGFGWAAFYFTAFTALWKGQTLGKKLLGIKVLQLDGTPLSLWDSFGRYGGYGAGLATGLLGFIQIYWDANRQAIQDKISSTVVINIRK